MALPDRTGRTNQYRGVYRGLAHGVLPRGLAASLVGCICSGAHGQTDFFEFEPNDVRATATLIPSFAPGDRLIGYTAGSTGGGIFSADYLFVELAAGPPLSLFEIRLFNTRASEISFAVRGVQQANGVPTNSDVTLQASVGESGNARLLRVYAGGATNQRVMLRASGRVTVTADYVIATQRVLLTPIAINNIAPGPVTITTQGQGHSTDTEFWLFDANGQVIPDFGIDDSGVSNRGTLTRTLAPGIYYLGISDTDMVVGVPNGPQDSNRGRPISDSRGVSMNTSINIGVPLTFTLSHGGGSMQVGAVKNAAFEIVWYALGVGQVVPQGCSLADLVGGNGNPPADGSVDGNDFSAFLNAFGAGDGLGDIVGGDGNPPADGSVDGNDFTAFLNAFAVGC